MTDYTQGHRERLRAKYADSSSHFVNDYELLELLLTYAIPRKDVKPIAKKLLDAFGTLDNILDADVKALVNISGVGEKTAVLINLVREINKRADISRNNHIICFDSVADITEYFKNLLTLEKNEKIIVVTLDSMNRIIAKHEVAEGTANFTVINPKKILEVILMDNPCGVVIAHNHPKGNMEFSSNDIDFTLKIRDLLNVIGIVLEDHIVVGEDGAISMRSSKLYAQFFKGRKSDNC